MDVRRPNKKIAGPARQSQPDDRFPRDSPGNISHVESTGETSGNRRQSQPDHPDEVLVSSDSAVNLTHDDESAGTNEYRRNYGDGSCMMKSVVVTSAQLVLSGSMNKVYFTCSRRRCPCWENVDTDGEMDEDQTPIKRRRQSISSTPRITPREAARLASSRTSPRPTTPPPNSRRPLDSMSTPGAGLYHPVPTPRQQSSRGEDNETPRRVQMVQLERRPSENARQQRRQMPRLERRSSENEQRQQQQQHMQDSEVVVVVEQNTATPNSISVVEGIIASLERRAANIPEGSDNDNTTRRLSLKRKMPRKKLFTQREPSTVADGEISPMTPPFPNIFPSASRDPRFNPALHQSSQQQPEYSAIESNTNQQAQTDSEISDFNSISAEIVPPNFFNTDM